MQSAFPEAEVKGYQKLIEAMPINGKDRHVLAAAVVAKAGVLVTNNLKDFPAEACGEFGVEVQSADEFLLYALTLEPFVVHEALSRQASIKRKPPMSVADVLDHLEHTAPTSRRKRGLRGKSNRWARSWGFGSEGRSLHKAELAAATVARAEAPALGTPWHGRVPVE